MAGHLLDREAVLAANNAFYVAHEEGDTDTMRDMWSHDDSVVCTHPGWPRLRGWDSVWSAWERLLALPHRPQFIVTDAHVEVVGDVAWVSCDENLLGEGDGSTVSALNVFVCVDGKWHMVAHHGSPVIR
jgi:ketosteroid isomerase-like protein